MIIDDPTRRPSAPSVSVICFPHEDDILSKRVRDVLEGWAGTQTRATPEALTEMLVGAYPALAVHVRDTIAELWATDGSTWYVYRDGNLLSSLDDPHPADEAATA